MKLIPLGQNRFALVDDKHFERLILYKWYYNKRDNCAARGVSVSEFKLKKTIPLANEVLQLFNIAIDHKNGNALDNQELNLRSCTYSQNGMNRGKPLGGTSKYKGVCFVKQAKKWKAKWMCKHLGYFTSEEMAAEAYDKAARKGFGEFAALNFPREREQSCLRITY